MGRPANVVTNYSTLPLREIFARAGGEDAQRGGRRPSRPVVVQHAVDQREGRFAGAQVLMDDLAAVERSWSSLWDDALASGGWERWLISGGWPRTGPSWTSRRVGSMARSHGAMRAIELAEQGGRRKYLANARTTLGRVLTAQGEATSATAELRSAVALADELGSPLLRWQARAALSRAEREVKGGSDDADRHAQEAVGHHPRRR